MDENPVPPNTPEEILQQLALSMEEQLENRANTNTNQAFNISCLLGLAPSVLIALVVFLVTRFSWAAAGLAGVLSLISAIALAILFSTITRRKTIQRFYREEIYPEIDRSIHELGLDWGRFTTIAIQVLSENSILLKQINPSPAVNLNLTPIKVDNEQDEL